MQDKIDTNYVGEIADSSTETNISGELSLKDIIRQLWLRRKFILIVTFAFFLFGLFIAYVLPIVYTAETKIYPQSGKQSSSGNLGSIASIMGVNMGTTTIPDGTISPVLYPEIMNSLPFIKEIMQVSIVVKKSNGEKITLFDYYSDSQYRDINILNIIKKYTIGLPKTIGAGLASKKSKSGNIDTYSSFIDNDTNIVQITPIEQSVYNSIKGSIVYNPDSKKGIITLGYTFPEPQPAAQITVQLYKSLEKYVTSYKLEKVEENLAFVERNYTEARKDFIQKQNDLVAYQDANRGLITATGKATETRLRSEYDIAFTIYSELAKQREQAKLAVRETKPVLTVLNPVIVPLKKSAPKRKRIIAAFVFLGFIISCSWIYIYPLIKEITKSDKQNSPLTS